MQRQFTLELRVDYADNNKNEAMRKAMQAAARHVYATALLLKDQAQPQIAIFSDDFFTGHAEIALMDNTVQKGLDELSDAGLSEGEEAVSDEMREALSQSK